jgi:hypothetical protein
MRMLNINFSTSLPALLEKGFHNECVVVEGDGSNGIVHSSRSLSVIASRRNRSRGSVCYSARLQILMRFWNFIACFKQFMSVGDFKID